MGKKVKTPKISARTRKALPQVPTVLQPEPQPPLPIQAPAAPAPVAEAKPAKGKKPATNWHTGRKFDKPTLLTMVREFADSHRNADGWDLLDGHTDAEVIKALGGSKTFGGAVGMVQHSLRLKERAKASKQKAA